MSAIMQTIKSKISVRVGDFDYYFFKSTFSYVNAKRPKEEKKKVPKKKFFIKVPKLNVNAEDWSFLDDIDTPFLSVVCDQIIELVKRRKVVFYSSIPRDTIRTETNWSYQIFNDDGFGRYQQAINNKNQHSLNGNIQIDFSSAFNLMLQQNQRRLSGNMALYRVEGTPDHDPVFYVNHTYRLDGERIPLEDDFRDKTKKAVREKISKAMVLWLKDKQLKTDIWIKELIADEINEENYYLHKIPKLTSKKTYHDENKVVIFNRLIHIEVPSTYYSESDSHHILTFKTKEEKDKLLKVVKRDNIFPSGAGILSFIPEETACNSRVYSNHTNFNPHLRVIFKIDEKFQTITDTEGPLGFFGGMKFIPKNLLRIKTDKWHYGTSVPSYAVNSFIIGLTRQQFTLQQMIDSSAICSSLRMFTLKVSDFKSAITTFYALFKGYFIHLNETHGNHFRLNADELYQYFVDLNIYIPIGVVKYSEPMDVFKSKKFVYPTSLPSLEYLDNNSKPADINLNQSRDDIMKILLTQVHSIVGREMKQIKFDFSNFSIPHTLGETMEMLTPMQKYCAEIVKQRMYDQNMLNCMVVALRVLDRTEDFNRAVLTISRLHIVDLWNPGFERLMQMKGSGKTYSDYISASDKHTFVEQHFSVERKICYRAQLEFQNWLKIFGVSNENFYFNTIPFLKQVIELREDIPFHTMGLTDSVINPVKAFMQDISNTRGTLKEINDTWMNNKHKITNVLEKISPNMSNITADADFTTFQSSLVSVKNIINNFFRTALNWVTEFFGYEVDPKLDFTTCAFYYMIWRDDPSYIVKYFIIFDICSTLGIADLLISFIRTLYDRIIGFVTKTPVHTSAEFDEYMASLNDNYEIKSTKVQQLVDNEDKEDVEVDETPILKKIMEILETSSPYILGSAAVLLAGTLAVPVFSSDKKSIGATIIQSARNMSFLAAGLLAVPKIFTNIVAMFQWVFDQAKSLYKEKHKTKMTLNAEVVNWLANTAIFTTSVAYNFVRSPELCIEYQKLYQTAINIRKREIDLEINILNAFRNRFREFSTFYEPIRTSILTNFGIQEVFHVQLYGDPGCGKTDVSDHLMKTLMKVFQDEEIKLGIVDPTSAFGILSRYQAFGGVYNMNETLAHMDGYFGQHFIKMDDCNIFRSLDPEVFINQIMMVSGTATIMPQADLNSKGRVFTGKVLVSNTNNPFIKPSNMETPQALWRRRKLFKVSVKPEFVDPKTNKMYSELELEKMLRDKNLTRTDCDHLLFSLLDSVDETQRVIVGNMDFNQFKQLVSALAKNHNAVEWCRAYEKDPMKAELRRKMTELHSLALYGGVYDIKKSTTELTQMIKAAREEAVSKAIKEDHTFKDKKPSDLLRNMASEKQIENLVKGVKFLWNEGEIEPELDLAHYSSVHTIGSFRALRDVSNDVTIIKYQLVDEIDPRDYSNVNCDLSKIQYTEENGKRTYTYTTPVAQVDKKDEEKIRGTLMRLSILSNGDADSYLKYETLSEASCTKIQKLKVYLEEYMRKIKRLSVILFKDVIYGACKLIGTYFVDGLFTAFGLILAFVVMGQVSQVLSPSHTSYGAKAKPVIIPGLQHTSVKLPPGCDSMAFKSTVQIQLGSSIFHAVGVKGNIFLANWHSLKEVDKNMKVKIKDISTGREIESEISVKDVVRLTTGPVVDAGLIYIRNMRAMKSLYKRFVTEFDLESDMINLRMSNGCLSIPSKDYEFDVKPLSIARVEHLSCPSSRLMLMASQTKRGDSGTLVYHDNNRLSGRFLGITTASSPTGTFIAVISREQIEHGLKHFDFEKQIEVDLSDNPEIEDSVYHTVFKYNQIIKQSSYPPQGISKESGFVKTPIHGAFPVESFPAIQSENDPRITPGSRHFLEVALNKTSGTNFAKFSIDEEKFMKDYLLSVYHKYIPGLDNVRLYNVPQAIMGTKNEASSSMDLSTSCGLPYKLMPKVKGKAPFITIDKDNHTYNITEFVYNEVEIYKTIYTMGKVPIYPMLEFRKMELVPESKILEPKTRTVGTGNMIHQILYNQIYKDLYTIVKSTWNRGVTTPFALGVDFERHWDLIAQHLKWHDYMLDMDVKAWEEKVDQRLLFMTNSVKLKIIKAAYESRHEKFDDQFEKIAYGICSNYSMCDVAFENIIYEKYSGLLSGHPGTFMENTEIHEMIFGLACRKILLKYSPKYATTTYILANTRTIKAADDIIISISPQARSILTIDRLVQAYNEIGFQVTAADKSDKIVAKTISEVQFLKTKFKERLGTFVPVPNKSIPHQLFNWVRTQSKLPREEQLTTNYETAFRYMWWRGRKEFEEAVLRFNIACSKARIPNRFTLSYDEYGIILKRELEERTFAELHPVLGSSNELCNDQF